VTKTYSPPPKREFFERYRLFGRIEKGTVQRGTRKGERPGSTKECGQTANIGNERSVNLHGEKNFIGGRNRVDGGVLTLKGQIPPS